MRLLPFLSVVGILAATIVFSLMLSERGLILSDRPVVAHLGTIRQPPDFDLGKMLDDYGTHLVHPGRNIDRIIPGKRQIERYTLDAAGPNSIPAAGRSIKEISFFGMPFGWYDELGPVVYVENKYETIYAELNSRGMAAVNRANNGDIFEGRIFPFWAHGWGWLWVIGLGIAIWLWLRFQAGRRAEEGLI